jgi:hypothetical protein
VATPTSEFVRCFSDLYYSNAGILNSLDATKSSAERLTRFYQKNQKCGTPEMRKELNQLRESLSKHIALERKFVKDLFDIDEAIFGDN